MSAHCFHGLTSKPMKCECDCWSGDRIDDMCGNCGHRMMPKTLNL